ncbi:NF038143 family protein [Desulforhopalus singaporensis]|uniref:Uncharacterized protein n=1 Tax=Desulforhopalus singaporensis TaxID=91360 RepID=A0A1H0URU4_9BACT|nr:NF038143 family protein [Desulforhopalus singaporensis]SDP68835.1 hypothetical protein SAMN05660330_03691 [Desulforhopalus singaporensis]
MGTELDRKKELILGHEQDFAKQVAGEIIDKPQLALWMILIPIFFVFYYFQLKRYRNGLQDFSSNFLVTRQRTLDAVVESVAANKPVNLESVIELSSTPTAVQQQYRAWLDQLAAHFLLLLKAEGDSYEELVRSAHGKKSTYLVELKKLNRVEADFNRSLISHIPGEQDTFKTVIRSMQDCVKKIRHRQAADIFP